MCGSYSVMVSFKVLRTNLSSSPIDSQSKICITLDSGKCRTIMNGTLGKPMMFQTTNFVDFNGTMDTIQLKLVEGTRRTTVFTYKVAEQAQEHHERIMNGRLAFHTNNFTLEIVEIKREDKGLYDLSVEKDKSEIFCTIQLDVYEQVFHLHHIIQRIVNGSCTITLNCTAEKGDQLRYTWHETDGETSQRLYEDNSILLISPDPGEHNRSYTCTASNPVSEKSTYFNNEELQCYEAATSPGRSRSLILAVILSFVMIIIMLTVLLLIINMIRKIHGRHGEHAEDNGVDTVYAKIQRPQAVKNYPQSAADQESITVYELAGYPGSLTTYENPLASEDENEQNHTSFLPTIYSTVQPPKT